MKWQSSRYAIQPACIFRPRVFSFSSLNDLETYSENEKTQVEIFDVLGRSVKTFDVEGMDGSVYWRGIDDRGNHLAAGIYFVRVGSATVSQILPAVVLK